MLNFLLLDAGYLYYSDLPTASSAADILSVQELSGAKPAYPRNDEEQRRNSIG